nr:retrotransposon protein, putative, Ty1-copia subclass [Tanacetum cinerariifolium]
MDGNVHTYKSCLIAKGHTQTYEIDYEETCSHVADIRSVKILIAIATYYDCEIWKMEVKTAFLNNYLDEASKSWKKRLDDEIKNFGFTQILDEPYVYQKASRSNVALPVLYVDDIIIMGNHIRMLQDVKSYLGKCSAMKDVGETTFILGMKIYRDRSKRLFGLTQSPYMDKILKRFSMDNSKRDNITMQERLYLRFFYTRRGEVYAKCSLCLGCRIYYVMHLDALDLM